MQLDDKFWAKEVLDKIIDKLDWVAEKNRIRIPYTTDSKGNFDDHSQINGNPNDFYGISWWTNGIYPGILWKMYFLTKNVMYKKYAEKIEDKLTTSLDIFEGLHHDVGFMFFPTSVVNYSITGSNRSHTNALHAATILAGRFNLAGRFLRAWNDDDKDDRRGWTIIDSMMNIELLYWATQETNDPRFKQIAEAHATTVQKYFVRDDGSVKHIVDFDPDSGEYLRSYGGQGFQRGSTWTRGQAWATYGFSVSYEKTNNSQFLETAIKTANYFIEHVPDSLQVPVDFLQPQSPNYEDSSAAAIFASALLELVKNITDKELAKKYYQFSIKLLHMLVEKRVDFTKDRDNLVIESSASYHEEMHGYSIIYADYFLIEALMKLSDNNLDDVIWQDVK